MGQPATTRRIPTSSAPVPSGSSRRPSAPAPRRPSRAGDADEQTRQDAQAKANRRAGKPGVLTVAVPKGSRPPPSVVRDKRWRRDDQPVTARHATTGQATTFDVFSAWIPVNAGQVIATGLQTWERLVELSSQMQPTEIRFGHILDGVVHPWDRFARGQHTLIYLTTRYGRILYYDSEIDGIREATHREFLDTITWGAVAKAGKSAEGLLPLYNALVFAALKLVPGGTVLEQSARAASLLVFWQHNEDRIRACLDLMERVLRALRVIYHQAPRLGTAMLRLALGEATLNMQEAIKKEGLARVIGAQLDGEKFLRYVAELFAVLLKLGFGGGGGNLAKVLDWAGLKMLAKVAGLLGKWRTLTGAVGKVASGGGLKDPQDLATAFVRLMGEAGVRLAGGEADGILKEGGLSNPDVVAAITTLGQDAPALEAAVKKLADDAKKKLF